MMVVGGVRSVVGSAKAVDIRVQRRRQEAQETKGHITCNEARVRPVTLLPIYSVDGPVLAPDTFLIVCG